MTHEVGEDQLHVVPCGAEHGVLSMRCCEGTESIVSVPRSKENRSPTTYTSLVLSQFSQRRLHWPTPAPSRCQLSDASSSYIRRTVKPD